MIKDMFKMKCPNCKYVFIDEIGVYACKIYNCPNCNCSLKVSKLYIMGYMFSIFLSSCLGNVIGDKVIKGDSGLEKFISGLIVGCTVGLVLLIYAAVYPKKLSIKNKKDK